MTEKWDQVCVLGGVDCVWLKTVNPVGPREAKRSDVSYLEFCASRLSPVFSAQVGDTWAFSCPCHPSLSPDS